MLKFHSHHRVVMFALHLHLLIIPKVSRCTVDMLSQILYDKTEDVGKLYENNNWES